MLEVMAGVSFDVTEPSSLCIAVSVKPAGITRHRTFRAAVWQCADLLAGLGHTADSEDPAYPRWFAPVTIARWFGCPVTDAEPYLAGSGLERRTGRHVRASQVMMRLRPPRETDRDRLRVALAPLSDRHDVLVMPSLGQAVPATGRASPHRTWSHPC